MQRLNFHCLRYRDSTMQVSAEELQSFAANVGLNRIAGGRCATLFLSQPVTSVNVV
jgi:hypothetical protein